MKVERVERLLQFREKRLRDAETRLRVAIDALEAARRAAEHADAVADEAEAEDGACATIDEMESKHAWCGHLRRVARSLWQDVVARERDVERCRGEVVAARMGVRQIELLREAALRHDQQIEHRRERYAMDALAARRSP
jgi:flagellar export protein FliJ